MGIAFPKDTIFRSRLQHSYRRCETPLRSKKKLFFFFVSSHEGMQMLAMLFYFFKETCDLLLKRTMDDQHETRSFDAF